jgi:hypothetical protein
MAFLHGVGGAQIVRESRGCRQLVLRREENLNILVYPLLIVLDRSEILPLLPLGSDNLEA